MYFIFQNKMLTYFYCLCILFYYVLLFIAEENCRKTYKIYGKI